MCFDVVPPQQLDLARTMSLGCSCRSERLAEQYVGDEDVMLGVGRRSMYSHGLKSSFIMSNVTFHRSGTRRVKITN